MRDDLNSHTVRELKDWLLGLGYYLPPRINKNDLIEMGKKHRKWENSFRFFHKIWRGGV